MEYLTLDFEIYVLALVERLLLLLLRVSGGAVRCGIGAVACVRHDPQLQETTNPRTSTAKHKEKNELRTESRGYKLRWWGAGERRKGKQWAGAA